MQRTPPRNRASFSNVPLPPSPGESGGECRPVAREVEDEEDEPLEIIEERMAAARKLYADLRAKVEARGARRRASISSSRSLHMEYTETPVAEYYFDDQETSPLNCDASFGSTASLIDTVKRRPKKRGILTSPEIITTAAMVHPPPENRGARSGGGATGAAPKRMKTGRRLDDLERIETVGVEAPPRPSVSVKIPPIVLRDGSKWLAVSDEFRRLGYNITKAKSIREGVRFFPATSDDYRAITSTFDKKGLPYHTYQLPEDKLLNVVFRDVPTGIPESEVQDALVKRGFRPESIVRMRRRRGGEPIPLVLVKINKEQKQIYHVTELFGLEVSVEPLRSRPGVGQCFRCQLFGHAQARCTAPVRCVICAGPHYSRECDRPRDQPATCANCGGGHPASYRGCDRCPRRREIPFHAASGTPRRSSANVIPGRSYSRVAASQTAARNEQIYDDVNQGYAGPTAGNRDFPPLKTRPGAAPLMSPEVTAILYSLQDLFTRMSATAQALNALLPPRQHCGGRD